MNATDARGTRHRRCDDHGKLRIVSLAPSSTELLCALGLGAQVVGRTRLCIHPADEVERITKVGGQGDQVDDVDVEKIRQLAPTHLVIDADRTVPSLVARLDAFVPHVVVTRLRKPRDNLELYRLFGHVFACERESDRLCARFEAAWETLTDARREARHAARPVLVLVGMDPWTTIARDGYAAAMLELIGWQQVVVTDADLDAAAPPSPHHPAIDLDRAARAAELVALACEPYRFTDSHVAMLTSRGLPACLVDGELLTWYGSRAIAGLEYLNRLASHEAPSFPRTREPRVGGDGPA